MKLKEEHDKALSSNETTISELSAKLEITQGEKRQLAAEAQSTIAELTQKLQSSESEYQKLQRYVALKCLHKMESNNLSLAS